MPPSAPSLTSQARAAELNAATRARMMNGELEDISELPSSQPVSLADLTMPSYNRNRAPRQPKAYHRGEAIENTEGFKRPNRPVERYYPPVGAPQVPFHPQYIDPRGVPMYGPAPAYPMQEYYYPIYQGGVPGYQQMYPIPSHMNNFTPATAGIPIAGPSVAPGFPAGSHSVAPSPVATPPVVAPVTPKATPPVTSQMHPASAKEFTPKSSPSKLVEEATETLFRPQDMSPSKLEEDIIRCKAAAPPSPIADQRSVDGVQDGASSEASPTKPTEANDDSKRQIQGPKFHGSGGQATPSTKHSEASPPYITQTPVQQNRGTYKAELEHPTPSRLRRKSPPKNQRIHQAHLHSAQKLLKLDDLPLSEKNSFKSLASTNQPNFQFPEDTPRSDNSDGKKGNVSSTKEQQSSGEPEIMEMSQKDDTNLFSQPSNHDEPHFSETPVSGPRRLQSPFQQRLRPPVKFYEPIVNKYPKNVFASEYTRLQVLRSIDNDTTWREFQRGPRVEGLPGPFKGFPQFPMPGEDSMNSLSLGMNGTVMPPPGLGGSARSRNLRAGGLDRASAYYDRVLSAEDWFHQSIPKKNEYSTEFQRKLDEERAMLYRTTGKSHDLTTPAMTSQISELFRHVAANLSSYANIEENKKRSFGFSGYGRVVPRREPISTSDDPSNDISNDLSNDLVDSE